MKQVEDGGDDQNVSSTPGEDAYGADVDDCEGSATHDDKNSGKTSGAEKQPEKYFDEVDVPAYLNVNGVIFDGLPMIIDFLIAIY